MNDPNKELESIQQELDSLKQQLDEANVKIKFHEYIFSNLGLNINEISVFENKILELKKNNENELSSINFDSKELAYSNLQNEIVDYLSKNVKCKDDNLERYESILKDEFDNVWKVLSTESKSYLITSKITFDSIKKNDLNDTLDYSGVCLLVTKALEIELYNIFFKDYIDYLLGCNLKLEKFPNVLLTDDKDKIKPYYLFSLGSVLSIFGLSRKNTISLGNMYCYHKFEKYCEEKLYTLNQSEIQDEIFDNAYFIEKVRKDYRNPAAHTGHLTRTVCSECLDYIVDTEKQLKRMLENMTKRMNSYISECRNY